MKNIKDVHKILIVNLGGIGDLLLSTPALLALRKGYPTASIVFMGVPRVCEVARTFVYFDRVIPFTFYDEGRRRFSGSFRIFKFLLELRKEKFDLTINMRTIVSLTGALRMAFLFWMIGSRYRLGRDTESRGFFLNMKIPESEKGDMLEMEYDLKTIGLLGVDVSDRSFNEGLFGPDLNKIEAILKKEGIRPSDRVVVVNPGGMFSHRWPLDHFASVIEDISKRFSCKIVVVGGSSEMGLSSGLKMRFGEAIVDLVGRLSFSELAGLLKGAKLFITNDTGSMHIAAILKIPMVAIFGPGYLKRFDPSQISDKTIVLYKSVHCSPCDKQRCGSLECLKEIKVDDVLNAALRLLEK